MDSRVSNLSTVLYSWYQDTTFANEQVLGGCDSWLQLSQSTIEERSFYGIPYELQLEKTIWPDKSEASVRCSNSSEIEEIVGAFNTRTAGLYSCGNNSWKMDTCYDESLSVCIDCVDPCDPLATACEILSFSPCSTLASDAICGGTTDYGVLLSIKYRVRSPPPLISSIRVTNRTASSISVEVDTDSSGYVSCIVLPLTQSVIETSIASEIYEQGVTAVIEAINMSKTNTAFLTLSGLTSLQNYHLYCGSESSELSKSSAIIDILASETLVTTTCCKEVRVTSVVSGSTYVEGSVILDFLTLTVDASPSEWVGASVSVHYQSTSSVTNVNVSEFLFPSHNATFYSDSELFVFSLNYNTLPGTYVISVELSGASQAEFTMSYIGSTQFTVFASDEEPPLPVVLDSVFSYDGTSVFLTFDSPTDMGDQPFGVFPCISVVVVANIDSLLCNWIDRKNLSISVAGNSQVVEGSEVRLLSGVLRAKCTVTSCATWTSMSASSLSVTVPSSSMLPTVSATSSSFLGKCADLDIDLSASRGSLGRAWYSIVASVTSSLDTQANVDSIVNYFNFPLNQTKSNALVVPRSYLKSGAVYTISVQLCNFLHGCASHALNVAVTADTAPSVLIEGSPFRNIFRGDEFFLYSEAGTTLCENGVVSLSSQNIEYTWQALDSSGLTLRGLSSESKHPSRSSNYLDICSMRIRFIPLPSRRLTLVSRSSLQPV